MKLSYTSGNVVLDAPMPFGYAIEEGDPTAFVFKLLINGNIESISGPAGSLANSGIITLRPASLGTHVIEAFAAGSNPDVDPPFAQGPTFTVVAPRKRIDTLAFAGAGIGAAIILAVILVIFLVRRRTKRRLSPVDAAITQWANSPTVEPFVAFAEMGENSGQTRLKAAPGAVATDRVNADDGLREAGISATPFRFSGGRSGRVQPLRAMPVTARRPVAEVIVLVGDAGTERDQARARNVETEWVLQFSGYEASNNSNHELNLPTLPRHRTFRQKPKNPPPRTFLRINPGRLRLPWHRKSTHGTMPRISSPLNLPTYNQDSTTPLDGLDTAAGRAWRRPSNEA
ncbi:hypothetical protein FB45DRAFT_1143218 [Roridomyces roridus]|uniref:Uncharacterized protein n=1 Tax=Roridomyces roridus TaxID=1738132 RepID=A0AAD7C017_9AGAR|nr:hypothetical protein FB45DRAFT_1143218 [Roridomyces roridus]